MDACTCGHQAAAAVWDHDLAACMCALDKAGQLSVLVAAHIAQQAQHSQQLIDVEGPAANCVLHSLHQIDQSWPQSLSPHLFLPGR